MIFPSHIKNIKVKYTLKISLPTIYPEKYIFCIEFYFKKNQTVVILFEEKMQHEKLNVVVGVKRALYLSWLRKDEADCTSPFIIHGFGIHLQSDPT